ncbi:MAG: hypothetical protein ACTHNW_16920 [Mucilaginibacter sp.]
MDDFKWGPYADPEIKTNGQEVEEPAKYFDAHADCLSEGSEYMDDALRMTEQPLGGNI